MRPLLVLDLGNVLVDVDFGRFAARFAGARSVEAILAECRDGPRKLAHDRGEIAPRVFVREVAAWLGAPPEAVAAAWSDIFRPTAGAAERVAALAGRCELWLCSDTDPLHFARVLDDHPVVRRFDRYLLSYARGLLKRDPGAFAPVAAEAATGRPVLFVDDVAANVEAARAAGVPAVVFTAWADLDLGDLLAPRLGERSRGG